MAPSQKDEQEKYIAKLEKKLTRYESRLAALVEAYKTLQEEKATWDTTFKALTSQAKAAAKAKSPTVSPSPKQNVNVGDPLGVLPAEANDTASDIDSAETTEGVGDEEHHDTDLLEKIEVLSRTLASVNEAKAKMEATFLADKKTMLNEHDKHSKELEEELREARSLVEKTKEKLVAEQRAREEDQRDHVLMLKELQELVSSERLEKDELRIQVKEKEIFAIQEPARQRAEFEQKIQELSDELNKVTDRLKRSEEAAALPNKAVEQLDKEVSSLKQDHLQSLIKEQVRANQAEEQLKKIKQVEESRVAELETKLSELSDVVGTYDRLRQDDQAVIHKLRERLGNMDIENSALAAASHSRDVSSAEERIQVAELQKQVNKLKNLLRVTWKGAERHPDILESTTLNMSDIDDVISNDSSHRVCQLEYRQLKEEFENFKQTSLQKKPISTPSSPEETNQLEEQCQNLKTELAQIKDYFSLKEKEHLDIITRLQMDFTAAEDRKHAELSTAKEQHQKQILVFEAELQKQRTRTLGLLNDKDREIERLKTKILNCDFSFEASTRENIFVFPDAPSAQHSTAINDETSVAEEILKSPATAEGGLIHFQQQLSQMETELTASRAHVIDLVATIRDTERREAQLLEQMAALKEEIRKLERDRSRETANLEYLKNVCLEYMMTDSYTVKCQMITSIATILMFSPDELRAVRKKKAGWWSSSTPQ